MWALKMWKSPQSNHASPIWVGCRDLTERVCGGQSWRRKLESYVNKECKTFTWFAGLCVLCLFMIILYAKRRILNWVQVLLVKWNLRWSFSPQREFSTPQKESFSPTSSVFSVQSSKRHINIFLNNSHAAQLVFTALLWHWTVPFFLHSPKIPSSIYETYPVLLTSGSCVSQNIWLTFSHKVYTTLLIPSFKCGCDP